MKPELLHVRHELVGQLAIGQEAVALLGHARPRAEVHFVDRHRPRRASRRVLAPRAPSTRRRATGSREMSQTTDAVLRRQLRTRTPYGSVFFSIAPGARADLELVLLAVGQIRDEDLPDACRREQPHRVDAAVPAVEIADHAHALGVRRPDREVHAGGRCRRDAVRAELLERAMVRPFAEQVQIEIGEHPAVTIRIVDLRDAPG